jgi:transcriptional regulator NrdR family protein
MSHEVEIIKHGKRPTESFARFKLYDSVIAACRSVRTPDGQAEAIADAVCDSVLSWLKTRPEVTSSDIRVIATKHLKSHHPEAAYLYEQHRITI